MLWLIAGLILVFGAPWIAPWYFELGTVVSNLYSKASGVKDTAKKGVDWVKSFFTKKAD